MQRHDGDSPLLVGVAEDVAMRGFVQIEFGDCQQQAVSIGILAHHFARKRREEHLTARAVDRAARNGKRAFHLDVIEEPLLQTEAQAREECRVDCVDRNDAQLRVHPGAVSFDAGAKSPRMVVGIGMDLAEVARYEFDENKLAWFARKVYTEEEIAYIMRKRNRAERLAGFFAAKEATRKAFGHAIVWREVGVSHIHLSITHTATLAAAVVVLEGDAS